MVFHVITLFPKFFSCLRQEQIFLRGFKRKIIKLDLVDLRNYGLGRHKQVDDRPFGGGAGMLLMPEPLWECISDLKKKLPKAKVVYLTPQGKKFTQKTAIRYAKQQDLILLCGHYEGIDQRIRDTLIDEEISVGDYVLTGGELPALTVINAVSRMLPGFLGKDESAAEDSFMPALEGKKEYPHYTRPAEFRGMKVPDILLSGHHAEIGKWRKKHLK